MLTVVQLTNENHCIFSTNNTPAAESFQLLKQTERRSRSTIALRDISSYALVFVLGLDSCSKTFMRSILCTIG